MLYLVTCSTSIVQQELFLEPFISVKTILVLKVFFFLFYFIPILKQREEYFMLETYYFTVKQCGQGQVKHYQVAKHAV